MPHQRPSADTFSFAAFRCPVCNSTAYARTTITRPSGTTYLTPFFECLGCTLMFRHPGRFARLGVPIRRWAGDVEPRTLREVHRFLSEGPEGEAD